MMDLFESYPGRVLLENLHDPNTFFVFPTQRSADSWAFALASSGKARAIESERFIGADKYRSHVTGPNRRANFEAASPSTRLFWALSVLMEQRGKPFLKDILPVGFDTPLSRAKSLAQMAPRLHLIRDMMLLDASDLSTDYISLAANYDMFLEKEKLFEQTMLQVAEIPDRKFMILAPELSGQSVEIPSARRQDPLPVPDLHKFRRFREELDWVFHSISNLLDKGSKPLEIAISVPKLSPDLRAHLLRTAREWKVPVTFFGGNPLSRSPFGKLLTALSMAIEEGFSARTLRKLAENGPIRWKNRQSFENLISIAERFSIPEMSNDRIRMAELWAQTFSECRINDAGATSLYRNLQKKSLAIRGAKTFQSLAIALFDFRTTLLDETAMDEYAAATLQRIFDGLEKLQSMHAQLHSPKLPAQPFAILLLDLDQTLYSPVVRSDAVSIQSYTLGVLLAAKAHFILDVSQDAAKTAAAYFNPLPEARDTNAETEAMLGKSILESFGPGAVFCHADEGISGFTVPHPFFALHGAGIVHHDGPSWPDSSDQGTLQHLGRAVQSDPVSMACAIENIPGVWRGKALRFSPSKLDTFMQCPFKWLLSISPGIDSRPANAALLAEGSLIHSVIRMMMEGIKNIDGNIRADHLELYLSTFDEVFSRCLKDHLRQSGIALRPGLESLQVRLKDRLLRLLEFEMELQNQGWQIGDFEVPLNLVLGEQDIVLEGRADRVLVRTASDDVAIIDYKRKTIPARKNLALRDDGSLREFQVAAYALMLVNSGKVPQLGLYWSIEACKSAVAFGSGGIRSTWADFETERCELVRLIMAAGERIRSGYYLTATPSLEACEACTIRSVCRVHFSSEHS